MHSLDTRLLQIFDEIYKTRSVSRAAEQLGLGQPVVSIALGKLRQHFGDPLFVRTSSGMDPTPLGEELVRPIRNAIDALQAALGYRTAFDPRTVQRMFRIAMTDISQIVLLPGLWTRLHQLAPGVTVDVANLSLETAHMLESGEVDLALGFMPQLDAGFYQHTLFAQRYVCLASVDHPRIQGELTLERFQAEEHAMVISSGTGHGYLERELARQGVTRKVVLRVPNFLGVAFVVEHTDLVVTIPARLGEMLSQHGRFRIYPTPFALPGYTVKQFWHERFHHDPGNRWLRGLIRELLGEAAANARRP
ncbi:MAG: LysR family transcriptional regulator [Proteobacteria bacterium]|nr:LysR family transcriptional regulator [Pseudomonadota bacterium]